MATSTFLRIVISLYLMNIPQILVALGVIFLKNENDVIQEISKLEYLEHVSIF